MGEILSYGFMQRAMLAGIIVGLLCSVLSLFIVLKHLSFVGAGISHSAFGGVALGFLLNVEPTWTAAFFCVLIALLIGLIKQRGKIQEDTIIGIFFAATMALGILLIGLSKRYNMDLFGYLFGNILAISALDVKIVIAISFTVLTVISLFFKELLFYSFDEEMAKVSGLPTGFLNYLLLTLLALVIVVSIKVVGIVLVSALLVIPGATGQQLSSNYRGMLAIAILAGLLAVSGGLILSYFLNIPSGSTIVLLATFLFFLSLLKK